MNGSLRASFNLAIECSHWLLGSLTGLNTIIYKEYLKSSISSELEKLSDIFLVHLADYQL
jgi:hypothetical protein